MIDIKEIRVQETFIQKLKDLGWKYISPNDIDSLRGKDNKLILEDILKNKIKYIFNSREGNLTPDSIDIKDQINKLKFNLNEDPKHNNKRIYELLTNPQSVSVEGKDKKDNIYFIDFENIDNNDFSFTDEYVVQTEGNLTTPTRRPDIVLFINGIPVCVIELKKEDVSLSKAISQMKGNQMISDIPSLFITSQLLIVANGIDLKYGVPGSSHAFYQVWKENIKDESLSSYDQAIVSLLSKERFLDIMLNFNIFEGDVRKVARYNQYFAVKKVIERLKAKQGKERGGIIYHTQGSGKSLTMSLIIKEIVNEFSNSKLVIVTDRTELDKQITNTLSKVSVEPVNATSGKHLGELINSPAQVITTMIHKFDEKITPNLSEDVFVLIDEAHRTQAGLLNQQLREILPNAVLIGFTGTPILESEKRTTKEIFGEFIDKYTIENATADKVILPLVYQHRRVNVSIDDEFVLNKKVNEELLNISSSDEKHELIQNKVANSESILSTPARIVKIAEDIHDDFIKNYKSQNFTGIIATQSQSSAFKYFEALSKYSDLKVKFVISANDYNADKEIDDMDEESDRQKAVDGYYAQVTDSGKRKDNFEDYVRKSIKDGEIDLVIVVNKLLTGFDAPRLKVIYLDKGLKDHNLLQAIARVNRTTDKKDVGMIVDYRGLLGNLEKTLSTYNALSNYDDKDIEGVIVNAQDVYSKLQSELDSIRTIFKDIPLDSDDSYFTDALDIEITRFEFYELVIKMAASIRTLSAISNLTDVVSIEDFKVIRSEFNKYAKIRRGAQQKYEEYDLTPKQEQDLINIIQEHLVVSEVEIRTGERELLNPDFIKALEDNDFVAQKEILENRLEKYISENKGHNIIFYEDMSKKVKKILAKYDEGSLEAQAAAEEMKEIVEKIRAKDIERSSYTGSFENASLQNLFKDQKASSKEIGIDFSDIQLEKITRLTADVYERLKKPNLFTVQSNRNKLEFELFGEIYKVIEGYDSGLLDKFIEYSISSLQWWYEKRN